MSCDCMRTRIWMYDVREGETQQKQKWNAHIQNQHIWWEHTNTIVTRVQQHDGAVIATYRLCVICFAAWMCMVRTSILKSARNHIHRLAFKRLHSHMVGKARVLNELVIRFEIAWMCVAIEISFVAAFDVLDFNSYVFTITWWFFPMSYGEFNSSYFDSYLCLYLYKNTVFHVGWPTAWYLLSTNKLFIRYVFIIFISSELFIYVPFLWFRLFLLYISSNKSHFLSITNAFTKNRSKYWIT